MIKEDVYCKYEEERSEKHLEESRLNTASRLRGKVAGGREERRQEDQVRSRSRASLKSWECMGKKKVHHQMAEFYRKERPGKGSWGKGS